MHPKIEIAQIYTKTFGFFNYISYTVIYIIIYKLKLKEFRIYLDYILFTFILFLPNLQIYNYEIKYIFIYTVYIKKENSVSRYKVQ